MSFGSPRHDSGEELGSLAQSVRRTSLRQARIILIVIGLLNLVCGLFLFSLAETLVKQAIEKEKREAGPGMVFDEVKLKEVQDSQVRTVRLILAGMMVVGLIFIALGMAVYKAPVACTVTGLVLYVGLQAAGAAADPSGSLIVWLIKLIIVIALLKAVQAALAYERETKAQRATRRDEFETGMSEEPYAN